MVVIVCQAIHLLPELTDKETEAENCVRRLI